jgi:hypothetical protein
MKYKKYRIKSITIEHSYKKISLYYENKDLLLCSHLLYQKIKFLKEKEILIDKIEIGKNIYRSFNFIKIFIELSKNNELTIHLNSNIIKTIPLLTYPIIDIDDYGEIDDLNIIKLLN